MFKIEFENRDLRTSLYFDKVGAEKNGLRGRWKKNGLGVGGYPDVGFADPKQ